MKKFIRRISAAIAAAVMTVTAAGLSVRADTVADGWVKEDGAERRYMDGSPYTGWLNVDDGTKKYCLDGYLVTGSFTVDGRTYSFGKDGVLTGKGTVPAFSAECGEVNPDASMIDLTVYANKDDDTEYDIGNPVKMERWVKGKWTDCIGKNTEYAVDDIMAYFSYQSSSKVRFYPQSYTNNNFKEGYYRITLSAKESGNKKASAEKFCMVFKVTPKNACKDGWVTEGSMERRYKNGVPYTGWLNMKDGSRKYCLGGYLVRGELQMDDVIYTFNDDGICISTAAAVISGDCGGKITAGTGKPDVSIYSAVYPNETYYAVSPVRISRWEYGRWSGCSADNLVPGYYKADLSAASAESGRPQNVSAVFEAVPYEVVRNGWIKESGKERRYDSDIPYTGWLNNNDGTKKYCFDGYTVTGDFQIGKYIYSFGTDGTYTGIKRKLVLTASCGNAVSGDAEKLVITVTNTCLDGRDYAVGDPYKMERWEKGRWADCAAYGAFPDISDSASVLSGTPGGCEPVSAKMNFYPQRYTGYNFTPGYYRIAFSAWDAGKSGFAWQSSRQDVYAVFEVV